ncbi:alpha/beta hydrolase [Dyella sp.]|uniref:alpha/beta hydrolase n=1 Tax=Dyella sp. TaxID=1869338 RepID=UPI002ED5071B
MPSHRTWRRRTLWAATSFGLAFALALWCLGAILIHPARRHVGPPPADLDAQSLDFADANTAHLRGWYVAGQPGHGAVLLLHGVRADRRAMLARARFLHDDGYGVMLIDFQASGESGGEAITFGYRETADVLAALEQLHHLAPGERIGIIAASMGGAATLLAKPPVHVDALVLEQVYPSIDQALRDRLRLHLGHAGGWLTGPLLLTLPWHIGIDRSQLRPIDAIAAVTIPKLLIAGDADQHTRIGESQAMFNHAAGPKAFWVVQGAAHVDLYRYAGEAYRSRVETFLGYWLASRGEEVNLPGPSCDGCRAE